MGEIKMCPSQLRKLITQETPAGKFAKRDIRNSLLNKIILYKKIATNMQTKKRLIEAVENFAL